MQVAPILPNGKAHPQATRSDASFGKKHGCVFYCKLSGPQAYLQGIARVVRCPSMRAMCRHWKGVQPNYQWSLITTDLKTMCDVH
jgi:hypothetical protein